MVYELNNSSNNPSNNFTLKNWFGTLAWLGNAIKSKFIYNGQGIAFDRAGQWSYGNDFARNVIIFAVDINSSSDTDNRKDNFLVLDKAPTYDINVAINVGVAIADIKFTINFTKVNTKFSLSLHYNGDEVYLHMNKADICKLNVHNNISQHKFCLRSVSTNFTNDKWVEFY